MYRYWDGRSWSAALSPNPTAPPPSGGLGSPVGGSGQPGTTPLGPSGGGYGPGGPGTAYGPGIAPPRRRGVGWLVAIGVVVVVLIVVAVFVVRALGRGGTAEPGGGGSGSATAQVCPKQQDSTPDPQPGDGRVHAGKLSYPQLGDPGSEPSSESRVACGRGVLIQEVQTEKGNAQGGWFAAVLLGGLVAGDGFFSPQDGAQVVVKCVSGTFYGDSAVRREDIRNEKMTVDGHDGWIVETQLHFNVKDIEAKSERVIIVIVDTGDDSGLFYASIPENAEQYLDPARQALANLTVDG